MPAARAGQHRIVERGVLVGADDAQTLAMQVDQRACQVVDRGQDRCSVAPAEALIAAGPMAPRDGSDRSRRARRRLGAAQQRPEVLRILERVEHEDERRLAALAGAGEDLVEAGRRPWLATRATP